MLEDWQHGGFGLYVHWPFCQAKCPYCDFNSHVVANIDHARWKSAYVSEIRRVAEGTSGRVLSSIFFGGGTPSLMDVSVVEAVLQEASTHWSFANDIEITLEANPTSSEASRFSGYRSVGVNRLSLGVQALNEADLKALGRLHNVSEARAAVDLAMGNFDRVSFDLIYARQGQSLKSWESELREAISWGADHLSLYQLTIETGTAFGDRFANGKLSGLPSDDLATDMYFATQDICQSAELHCYETSNHARIGAESRHNQIYWKSGDYLGIGPGAHGRVTLGKDRYSTETISAPTSWLLSVENSNSGEINRAKLSSDDRLSEFFLMGLRLSEGVDLARLSNTDFLYKKINYLTDLGLLVHQAENLSVSAKGRPLLNAILRELFSD